MSARALMMLMSALLAIVSSPARVSAQTGNAVPRETMALLLTGPEGFGTRPFDLRVGSVPAGFPVDLLPGAAVVRVSAGIDGLAAVVAVVTRFSADERVAFEQQLEAGGWVNPLRSAGFAAREAGPSLSLCRGDRFATLSFLARSEGGSYIRASVATEPGRACLTRAPSAVSNVPLPSMSVPAGARSGRASMGGTADAMYSSIRLSTRQDLQAISAHYVGQLTSAGWTVEGQTADGAAMSVTRLRAAGSSGAPAMALLVVTAIDGSGEVDVLLRLVQPQGLSGARN